jgi:hypothetical protein
MWNYTRHLSRNSFNPRKKMMMRDVYFPYPPLSKCGITQDIYPGIPLIQERK